MSDKLDVQWVDIDSITPYENNPRKNDRAVDAVAESIKEFGFKVPMVISSDNVIVAGHTRYKAAKKLGIDSVPCIVADDLTDEQVRAFRLADNEVGSIAKWDWGKLDSELAELAGMSMERFGFDIKKEDTTYTDKADGLIYEPSDEKVSVNSVCDKTRYDELIKRVESSHVTDDEKAFLRDAATRFMRFDYQHIADYYAQASDEMRGLMEDSGLVIVDINAAIENGFVKMSRAIEEIMADAEK